MNFKDMHYQSEPLLICNVWDASSSRVAEKLGFQAVGTSSGAIAASLGYEDGEEISFSELKFMIEQIAKASSLPLTVDLESGYGDGPEEIADNIKVLTELGVVGINIEDSKVNETRELVDPETFCELLVEVRKILEEENIDLFINVRVDTYIMTLMSGMPQPLEETIKRIKVYEKAGVDGIFVPFISNSEDITEVTSATNSDCQSVKYWQSTNERLRATPGLSPCPLL